MAQVGLILDIVAVGVLPALWMIWKQGQKIDHLERDHDEIKEKLKDCSRLLEGLEELVRDKIEKIITDHGDHDKQNTRIETKIDMIVRKTEK